MPVYELWEARGCKAPLVKADPLTPVPGHKSAGQDCQGIQPWHTYGLLRGALRPDAERWAGRAYGRPRAPGLA